MGLRSFILGLLTFLLIVFMIALLFIYWFFPFGFGESGGTIRISGVDTNEGQNPLLVNGSDAIQFYLNMRYQRSRISYLIRDECTLQKKDEMERAFKTLEEATILDFYPVNSGEEITVTCSSRTKPDERNRGFFIAGEGGPTNITISGEFNVIFNGKVILIRESKCSNPNIGTHELLHALGFDHNNNPKSIMYPISDCNQKLWEEIPGLIDNLYSIPAQPDLAFEDVSAKLDGRYLDLNITVRNNGLTISDESLIKIYSDGNDLKEVKLPEMDVGVGRHITLTNIFISGLNVDEIELLIDSNFQELDKTNNEVVLGFWSKNPVGFSQ